MRENDLKVFSLKEAESLIPLLEKSMRALHAKREQIADQEAQIDAEELVQDSSSPEGARVLEQLIKKHQELVSEFYGVIEQIETHGCLLKDLNLGLVDFHGVVDERMVYWCWKFGEKRINHWHHMNEGYVNRHPIKRTDA